MERKSFAEMSDDVIKEHIENGKDVNEAAREKECDGKEEAQEEERKQKDNLADDSPTSSGEEERIRMESLQKVGRDMSSKKLIQEMKET